MWGAGGTPHPAAEATAVGSDAVAGTQLHTNKLVLNRRQSGLIACGMLTSPLGHLHVGKAVLNWCTLGPPRLRSEQVPVDNSLAFQGLRFGGFVTAFINGYYMIDYPVSEDCLQQKPGRCWVAWAARSCVRRCPTFLHLAPAPALPCWEPAGTSPPQPVLQRPLPCSSSTQLLSHILNSFPPCLPRPTPCLRRGVHCAAAGAAGKSAASGLAPASVCGPAAPPGTLASSTRFAWQRQGRGHTNLDGEGQAL